MKQKTKVKDIGLKPAVKKLKRNEKCPICGLYVSTISRCGGWGFGAGKWRLDCIGEDKMPKLHDLLEEKIWGVDNEVHPKQYHEELEKEIAKLRKKFKQLKK